LREESFEAERRREEKLGSERRRERWESLKITSVKLFRD